MKEKTFPKPARRLSFGSMQATPAPTVIEPAVGADTENTAADLISQYLLGSPSEDTEEMVKELIPPPKEK